MLVREADLELGALPDADEGEGMLAELLAGRRGLSARLGSLEQGRPSRSSRLLMRAETVDCVMLSLWAASMKLPFPATMRKVRARLMSMGRSRAHSAENLSIEIFDRRHRKNPFEEGIDSDHIECRPAASSVRFGLARAGRSMEGLLRWLKLQRSLPQRRLLRSRLRRRRSNEFLPRASELAVVSFRMIPASLIAALLSPCVMRPRLRTEMIETTRSPSSRDKAKKITFSSQIRPWKGSVRRGA